MSDVMQARLGWIIALLGCWEDTLLPSQYNTHDWHRNSTNLILWCIGPVSCSLWLALSMTSTIVQRKRGDTKSVQAIDIAALNSATAETSTGAIADTAIPDLDWIGAAIKFLVIWSSQYTLNPTGDTCPWLPMQTAFSSDSSIWVSKSTCACNWLIFWVQILQVQVRMHQKEWDLRLDNLQ